MTATQPPSEPRIFAHIETICRNVEIVRGLDFDQIKPNEINYLILLRGVSGDALTFRYLFLLHKAEFGEEHLFAARCRPAVGLVSCSMPANRLHTTPATQGDRMTVDPEEIFEAPRLLTEAELAEIVKKRRNEHGWSQRPWQRLRD